MAVIGFLVLKSMRSIKKTVILNACEGSTVIPLAHSDPQYTQLIDPSSLRSAGMTGLAGLYWDGSYYEISKNTLIQNKY